MSKFYINSFANQLKFYEAISITLKLDNLSQNWK